MSTISSRARWAWRSLATLALVVGLAIPVLGSPTARAQEAMPATAAAAPESTVFFHTLDLNWEGAQWQQAEALLAQVGVPDALDMARDEILREGTQSGEFSDADLDALLGGEMAIIVTQPAVERLLSMHMGRHGTMAEPAMEDATPEASGGEEAFGVAAVLLPGDPDAAWDYAQRQVNAYADQRGSQVETSQEGDTDLIWVSPEGGSEESGDVGDDPMVEIFGHHHGRGAFAAGRDGDFIIAAKTPADITSIAEVIDGAAPSLADAAAAQDVVSRLPDNPLSLTYINLEGIFASLDPSIVESLESFVPSMPREAWGGHAGFAFSADRPGFRFDTIATLPEGADLDALLVANDPAVVAQAAQVPAGTFLYEAGILPPNALAGLPFTFSQAINGSMAEEHMGEGPMAAIPTPEEIEAEIAQATQTLGFNPATDLFDLLGNDFIAFVSFPSFSGEGMGLNGVAAISTTDAPALSETFAKIVDWIGQSAPEAQVSERQVDGDTVYVLAGPEMEGAPAIEFGVVGDQAVVAVGDGIDELQSEPTSSLADDAQFQEVMGALPAEYYQVGYVDIGQAIAPIMMMTGRFDPSSTDTPSAGQGSLENLRALAFVGYRQDDAAGSSAILYIADAGS